MSDWESKLTAAETAEWTRYCEHARDELLPKMGSSAMVVSLVPEVSKIDVKYATELGFAILLGKPILAVAIGGVPIPAKLREIAEHVAEIPEVTSPEGQAAMQTAISTVLTVIAEDKQE